MNAHHIKQIEEGTRAARALAEAGHEVLAIRIGGVKPRIEVAESSHCAALDSAGGMQLRDPITGRLRRLRAAPFQDCQVEWEELH